MPQLTCHLAMSVMYKSSLTCYHDFKDNFTPLTIKSHIKPYKYVLKNLLLAKLCVG